MGLNNFRYIYLRQFKQYQATRTNIFLYCIFSSIERPWQMILEDHKVIHKLDKNSKEIHQSSSLFLMGINVSKWFPSINTKHIKHSKTAGNTVASKPFQKKNISQDPQIKEKRKCSYQKRVQKVVTSPCLS